MNPRQLLIWPTLENYTCGSWLVVRGENITLREVDVMGERTVLCPPRALGTFPTIQTPRTKAIEMLLWHDRATCGMSSDSWHPDHTER